MIRMSDNTMRQQHDEMDAAIYRPSERIDESTATERAADRMAAAGLLAEMLADHVPACQHTDVATYTRGAFVVRRECADCDAVLPIECVSCYRSVSLTDTAGRCADCARKSFRPIVGAGVGVGVSLAKPFRRVTAEQIATALFANIDGFTIDRYGRDDIAERYVVAYGPGRELEAPTRADVLAFVRDNMDALMFGTWRDPETGRVWLDTVRAFDVLENAVSFGRQHGQLAIFDQDTGEDIRLDIPTPVVGAGVGVGIAVAAPTRARRSLARDRRPNDTLRVNFGTNTAACVRRILAVWGTATDAHMDAGRTWYATARVHAETIAANNGLAIETATAVIAHLSPRTSWQRNLKGAYALCADPTMVKPAGCMRNNVYAAKRALASDRPADTLNGPKVRAFYANIRGDETAVTVDTWAVRIAIGNGMLQSEIEKRLSRVGSYDAVAHAYRVAAQRAGVSPAVMQAVTWVAARGRAN